MEFIKTDKFTKRTNIPTIFFIFFSVDIETKLFNIRTHRSKETPNCPINLHITTKFKNFAR